VTRAIAIVVALALGARASTPSDGSTGGVRAYYVNARGDADARLMMEDGFRSLGAVMERVEAMDASRASTTTRWETETCGRGRWAASGETGVERFSGEYLERLGKTLSHLDAIYRARDEGARAALVMEDDASPELLPTWTSGLDAYVERLPEDWTVVQLSAYGDERAISKLFFDWQSARLRAPGRYLSTLPKGLRRLSGTQAYLISRRGMDRLVRAYRAPSGNVDVCSLTCVEFEDCVLADGVQLDDKYRVATPPLFVPRGERRSHTPTVGPKDEVRGMLYSWAVSLTLTNGKAANLLMDGKMIQEVLNEAVKAPEKLAPNSFQEHFDYHCKLNHGGAAKCSIKNSYLVNQQPPRMISSEAKVASEAAASGERDREASLGRTAIPRRLSPRLSDPGSLRKFATSTPFLSMYFFAALAVSVFAASFTFKRKQEDASNEELTSIRPTSIDPLTEAYYS